MAGAFPRFHSWVDGSGISNHKPITLQVDTGIEKAKFPFKFNRVWLEDGEFHALVKNFWSNCLSMQNDNSMEVLVYKLKNLTFVVIKWEITKKRRMTEQLGNIEVELERMFSKNNGILHVDEKAKVKFGDTKVKCSKD